MSLLNKTSEQDNKRQAKGHFRPSLLRIIICHMVTVFLGPQETSTSSRVVLVPD
jgi:hypothetical protein